MGGPRKIGISPCPIFDLSCLLHYDRQQHTFFFTCQHGAKAPMVTELDEAELLSLLTTTLTSTRDKLGRPHLQLRCICPKLVLAKNEMLFLPMLAYLYYPAAGQKQGGPIIKLKLAAAPTSFYCSLTALSEGYIWEAPSKLELTLYLICPIYVLLLQGTLSDSKLSPFPGSNIGRERESKSCAKLTLPCLSPTVTALSTAVSKGEKGAESQITLFLLLGGPSYYFSSSSWALYLYLI